MTRTKEKTTKKDSIWPAYVPVSKRLKQAVSHLKDLKRKGQKTNPVAITGKTIANTFWGKSWCENLEKYKDYANRLPRGRTYVRNGSVKDLQIIKGQVNAHVMGSSMYKVTLDVKPFPEEKWNFLIQTCIGKINSPLALLKASCSKELLETLTETESGLFPFAQEITMHCSCPDNTGMCKHIAAVLYGVGTCLDTHPEWLFTLRSVNYLELLPEGAKDTLVAKDRNAKDVKSPAPKKKVASPSKFALKKVFKDSDAPGKPKSQIKTKSTAGRFDKKETKPFKTPKASLQENVKEVEPRKWTKTNTFKKKLAKSSYPKSSYPKSSYPKAESKTKQFSSTATRAPRQKAYDEDSHEKPFSKAKASYEKPSSPRVGSKTKQFTGFTKAPKQASFDKDSKPKSNRRASPKR